MVKTRYAAEVGCPVQIILTVHVNCTWVEENAKQSRNKRFRFCLCLDCCFLLFHGFFSFWFQIRQKHDTLLSSTLNNYSIWWWYIQQLCLCQNFNRLTLTKILWSIWSTSGWKAKYCVHIEGWAFQIRSALPTYKAHPTMHIKW